MKRTIFKIFVLPILLTFSTPIFGQIHVQDSVDTQYVQILTLKPPIPEKTETLNIETILTIIIPSIISLVGFILIGRNVKKQIQFSEEQLKKQSQSDFINELKSLIVQLLSELDPSGEVNYEAQRNTGFYSSKHKLIHYELLMLLDTQSSLEKNLSEELTALIIPKNNLSQGLVRISKLGKEIINQKTNFELYT